MNLAAAMSGFAGTLAPGIRRRLAASAFSRNVSVMLAGTVLGQATSILLAPVLTRLYTPMEFGTLGVAMSWLNILVVFAALRYEIPLATARTDVESANLLAICALALVLTTCALAILVSVAPDRWLAGIGLAPLASCRLLLPVGYACLGGYYVMLHHATRAQDFPAIARTRIAQGLAGPLSQIATGLLGWGAGGLVAGTIAGQCSGTLLLVTRTVLRRRGIFSGISLPAMRLVAWRHRGFPLIAAWAGMIDIAGTGQLIYPLVTALYPGPVVGYILLAERVVARPLQMLSTSLLTVFMAEAGRFLDRDPALLRQRFRQVTSRQLAVGAAWVLAIDAAAWLVFPTVFGAGWAATVPFLLVLSLAWLANSVTAAVGHTLPLLRRQALAAALQVARVVAICVGFAAAAALGSGAFAAICLYAAIQVAAAAILFLVTHAAVASAAATPCAPL